MGRIRRAADWVVDNPGKSGFGLAGGVIGADIATGRRLESYIRKKRGLAPDPRSAAGKKSREKTAAFTAGAHAALMTKVASLDGTVHDVVSSALKARLPQGHEPAPDDDLDSLLPDDGALETLVGGLEDNFDVSLDDGVVFDLFADGTVADLESAIVDGLVEKTAAFDSHAYYMRNRQRRKQQARAYRARNRHQIRRKAKIYRKQVARGARRRRRRVGSAAGGYSFIPR